LAVLIVLEFDRNAAIHYARTQARLLDMGKPSGPPDVLIAAVALANNQILVTRNTGHFSRIPGLRIEAY
jgi:tRNA(fMet)-specific endonuclease VapC